MWLISLGWDEGVVQMKLGEKATLDITRYDDTPSAQYC